jgi:hypothetical protein
MSLTFIAIKTFLCIDEDIYFVWVVQTVCTTQIIQGDQIGLIFGGCAIFY